VPTLSFLHITPFEKSRQLGVVFEPGRRYQAKKLLESRLKKAGIPPITEVRQKAKEELWLWIFPTKKYQEVYTMHKEEVRRLIIMETYLDTGNISLMSCGA